MNQTLVHAEARQRQLQEAAFAVCAPQSNDTLLKGGKTLNAFANCLSSPRSVLLMPLEGLIQALGQSIPQIAFWGEWIAYLEGRYLVR